MKKNYLSILSLFSILLHINCYKSKKDDFYLLTLLNHSANPIKVTVLGDSLSQWSNTFGLSQKLPSTYKVTDLSVAGYDTALWISELSRAEIVPTDIWIIELGTNDASYSGTNGFKERYMEILNRLKQRTFSYFLLSTVPKTNQNGLHQSILSNNEVIRELVKTDPAYRLADLEKVFSEKSDSVILYPLNDPIHPNGIGYELIGEEYRKLLLGFQI
ncbi:MAG: SGNH/GDSL hydrolase family protein [Leptospira sp.]|nr:SGNH/GDSL hydrolase family protein [Leptospira sp.]